MHRPQALRRQALSKTIVVCEGNVTEGSYLEGIRIERRIPQTRLHLHLSIGTPLTVVQFAVDAKNENIKRNRLDKVDVNDPVWAVFDRDDHPLIPEAKQLAAAQKINIAFTNPCFELFLLLHFEDAFRDEHRKIIASKLRKHVPGYNKHFDYEKLQMRNRYLDAKRRIEAINARSTMDKGIESAPFCSVALLVDYLKTY